MIHLFGGCVLSWPSNSMDQSAVTAAGGLHTRMQALDLLANNLANSSTNGFKLDREFYSLFSAEDTANGESPSQLALRQEPVDRFHSRHVDADRQPAGYGFDRSGILRRKRTLRTLVYAQRFVSTVFFRRADTSDGYPVAGDGGGTIQIHARPDRPDCSRRHGSSGRPDRWPITDCRLSGPPCSSESRQHLFHKLRNRRQPK